MSNIHASIAMFAVFVLCAVSIDVYINTAPMLILVGLYIEMVASGVLSIVFLLNYFNKKRDTK